jgi:prepilin-type N-terminal cleavage/methylation domain-containing protein
MILLSPKLQVKNKAFTLVELMVTIMIIGILVTIMAGAVVKWMAWQRDPTNPNSSVSQTINTIKQAVTRITQDIQQKAKQDYQALSSGDKTYYQTLAEKLKTVGLLTELDPNARALQVYANAQVVRNFPISVSAISNTLPVYIFNNVPAATPATPVFESNFDPANLNTCYSSTPPLSLTALSLAQQLLTANTIKKNIPSLASTNNRNSSACLLVALESHPKGLKVEDLGSGAISTDTTGARIIQPGGAVIYHKIHYVDAADYAADKSFKVGSLRVDIAYDTE